VNLSTGVNRALGGQLLDGTSTVAMALSPDGKQIAAITRVVSGREIENRVYLIDLTTGEASPVGSGVDAGSIGWMPEGKFLLVSEPRQEIRDNPIIMTLGRMNLDGQFYTMRKHAVNAQLLPDHKQVLYQSDEDHLWYTCDLAGDNPTLFAGGFKGYDSPAISPDGKQMIWMKQEPGKPTLPVMFTVGQAEGTFMTQEPGTWGLPVWK
jgi:Tol biopolymer transport system component